MNETQHHTPSEVEESDALLIARIRTGDIPAFEALYLRYRERLFSYAYRFHGNTHDAEDSVQEAFIAMFRKIGSFREEAGLFTWLFRILANTCISQKRRQHRDEQTSDFLDEYHHPVYHPTEPDAVLLGILAGEIGRLPELQRAVFLLFANEGFRHEDIAGILSIRVGTSKSYYHRAKETLKSSLIHRGINFTEVRA